MWPKSRQHEGGSRAPCEPVLSDGKPVPGTRFRQGFAFLRKRHLHEMPTFSEQPHDAPRTTRHTPVPHWKAFVPWVEIRPVRFRR